VWHPSSGAYDFSIVSPHWLCVLVSMRVEFWCGWVGVVSVWHPSSGACDFSIVSPHWLCVLVSMCVGVLVWLAWGGIRVASIISSLRLFYCITTLVVCSCFDVCWIFGVAGWGGIRVAG